MVYIYLPAAYYHLNLDVTKENLLAAGFSDVLIIVFSVLWVHVLCLSAYKLVKAGRLLVILSTLLLFCTFYAYVNIINHYYHTFANRIPYAVCLYEYGVGTKINKSKCLSTVVKCGSTGDRITMVISTCTCTLRERGTREHRPVLIDLTRLSQNMNYRCNTHGRPVFTFYRYRYTLSIW